MLTYYSYYIHSNILPITFIHLSLSLPRIHSRHTYNLLFNNDNNHNRSDSSKLHVLAKFVQTVGDTNMYN